MNETVKAIGGVISLAIIVAIVAVLVSRNANTSGITSSFFGGLTNLVKAGVAPVSTSY